MTGEYGKEGAIAAGIKGAIHEFTDSPVESVNYVTAHDNLNLWDKMLIVQGGSQEADFPVIANMDNEDLEEAVALANPYVNVDQENILGNATIRRSLLANGIILTSQGIPFLHAGDELLRSKFGDHNSYRSGDAVNSIRWNMKSAFKPVFQYYKGLIELRRTHPAFRLHGRQEIERSLEFLRCDGGIVSYLLRSHAGGDLWNNITVVFNANNDRMSVSLPEVADSWNVVVDHTRAGIEAIRRIEGNEVEVEGLSMMVLYDECGEPAPRSKIIEIHYERPDQNYQGWNLWVWDTGIQDGQCDFRYMENGRAVARIEVLPDTQTIGYILRLNDWEEKDGDGDRFIDCSTNGELTKVLVRDRDQEIDEISEDHLRLSS